MGEWHAKSRWGTGVDALRAGILFVEVKVVTVGVMVMVAVGVAPFFEKRSLSFNEEEESWGVSFGLVRGDILDFGGVFCCSGGGDEGQWFEVGGRSCC